MKGRVVAACLLAGAVALNVIGCSESGATTKPSTNADRALNDPMGYGPRPGATDKDKKRGDAFDGDGLNRDLKNVFDP